jgi:hypothetical protein
MKIMIRLLGFVLAAALSLLPDASATPPRSSHSRAAHARSEKRCTSCQRAPTGRIQRSATPRREFQRANLCPSTGRATGACPGYVVDHVVPLKRGGLDAPTNMQWQSIEAAKAKDRIEE